MSKPAPKNYSMVWHRGGKSFVELLKNNKKLLAYKEAPPGEQLEERAFELVFQVGLGLAKSNPNDFFHYTRYDQESVVEENDNNRPFRDGAMSKVIYYLGQIFSHHL